MGPLLIQPVKQVQIIQFRPKDLRNHLFLLLTDLINYSCILPVKVVDELNDSVRYRYHSYVKFFFNNWKLLKGSRNGIICVFPVIYYLQFVELFKLPFRLYSMIIFNWLHVELLIKLWHFMVIVILNML